MASRPNVAAAAIFVLAFGIGGAMVWQGERLRIGARREGAARLAASAAFSLEQQVSRSLSATYALAAVVRRDPQFADFDALAAEMISIYGGIASLQLAPGAVIGRIHPLAGNEPAIGHDLLRDPDRRFQTRAAIDSRKLTVAGPLQLKQGGLGLIGRLAVFLPDPAAPGRERFWGLVTAVMMVPSLLDRARVGRLEEAGYVYRMTRFDPERGTQACFAACDGPAPPDPVTVEVEVPNGAWTLEVAPRGGWPGRGWFATGLVAAAVVAAALALLGRHLVALPARLQQEVALRTAELASSNAALANEMAELQAAREATRRAEEQLRHGRKMEALGRLAGGIAHDFNNLLTAILGYSAVLLDQSQPGTEMHEGASTIAGAARRAAELTRQLLRFARQEPVELAPLDVNEVIREVARLLSRTLDPRIRLTERCAPGLAIVLGDAGQFQQALLNLAVNAGDAMPDGGELRMESARVVRDEAWCANHPGTAPGPYVAISVTDTGGGIPAELRERIFDPFFTTKEAGRGTGLGLSVVYGVMRSHGGAVDVESEVERGTRFTLSLPLAEDAPSPAARPQEAVPAASGTILLVDDDPIPRGAVTSMLRAMGYTPVAVPSCEEAVRWTATNRNVARAVLLDVAMPGGDGATCHARLLPLLDGAPIVFISGFAEGGRAQTIAAEGKASFLSKPFEPRTLARVLADVIAAAGR